jgi:hypothetical protein
MCQTHTITLILKANVPAMGRRLNEIGIKRFWCFGKGMSFKASLISPGIDDIGFALAA